MLVVSREHHEDARALATEAPHLLADVVGPLGDVVGPLGRWRAAQASPEGGDYPYISAAAQGSVGGTCIWPRAGPCGRSIRHLP